MKITDDIPDWAAEAISDNTPSEDDFRTAARVNRWVAGVVDKIKAHDPFWKRITTVYASGFLRKNAAEFEELADNLRDED